MELIENINLDSRSASVMVRSEPFLVRATASASNMGKCGSLHDATGIEVGKCIWYLNRCIVESASHRGTGLGSRMLKLLLDKLRGSGICDVVVVTPGGYGSDPQKQIRFYQKNGFKTIIQETPDDVLMTLEL